MFSNGTARYLDLQSRHRNANDVKAEFDIMSLDEIYDETGEMVWRDGLSEAI